MSAFVKGWLEHRQHRGRFKHDGSQVKNRDLWEVLAAEIERRLATKPSGTELGHGHRN